MKLSQFIAESLAELRVRKLRTLLTLLGMLFGTAAIVSMLGIGEGSRREALRLVQSLGLNNLIVESVPLSGDAATDRRRRSLGLSLADGYAVQMVLPGSDAIAAQKSIHVWSVLGQRHDASMGLLAVSPSYIRLSSLQLSAGRDFTKADNDNVSTVALLGYHAARTLFPNSDALGKLVKVNHVPLIVIGVLQASDLGKAAFEGTPITATGNSVIVPLSTGLERFHLPPGEDEVDRLIVHVGATSALADKGKLLAATISARHGGVKDFKLVIPFRLFEQSQRTQRIFNIIMISVAAISLIVGGIGIMNIMLANILERRAEIGLMRALGATQKFITQKFLAEAFSISMIGALLGGVVGLALAYSIAFYAGWPVAWDPAAFVASVLSCTLIGSFFGVYPARQAAKLEPILALRGVD